MLLLGEFSELRMRSILDADHGGSHIAPSFQPKVAPTIGCNCASVNASSQDSGNQASGVRQ